MAIAVATDAGWKRPVVGPGLEDFKAGDAKGLAAPVAAGGPGSDAAPLTSVGNQARIALEEPATPAPVAAPPAQGALSQKDLLQLLTALTGLLASLTNLVAKMVEQRGFAVPAAA